jgi:hypothetical protein
MLQLLWRGDYAVFTLLIVALVLSLTVHELGHALVAKWFGDTTAERAGRITLNPIAHIDPMGLLMVVVVGFGFAKPVPTNPANFTSKRADLWVAACRSGDESTARPHMLECLCAGLECRLAKSRSTGVFHAAGAN